MTILNILGCIINSITIIYILFNVYQQKIDLYNKKIIILSLFLVIFYMYSSFYISSDIKLILNVCFLIIYSFILFNDDIITTITNSILSYFTMVISEIFYVIVLVIIFKNNFQLFIENVKSVIIANVFISLLAIFLINNKQYYNIVTKIKCYIYNFDNRKKYFLFILFIITLNLILITSYFSKNFGAIFLVNVIFILIYSLILYGTLLEKNENVKFKIENDALMNNLNEYEKMLDYQRVANHENKNQLLIIKTMIKQKDKRVSDFINEIIVDKRTDNEELYSKAKKLPTGGLQGIIYQKMLVMEENKIKIFLNVDKKIKNIDFSNIDSKTNYDLCRIVGIFLDNAIDESKKTEKKEININLYFDEYFIIEISNYFFGNLDIEKIYDKGYSTKGTGHGYGLNLVKDIINRNIKIINECKIKNDIFMQIVKIKM